MASPSAPVVSRCLDENEVAEFCEGSLDEPAQRSIEAHLDVCETCRSVVAGLASAPAEREAADPGVQPRIDRYELLSPIGRGGMGVVYVARDPELDREVALKLIRAELRGSDGAAILLHEARAMARVVHPNVVAVLDVGRIDGEVFVAMELVAGTNLARWLAQGPRPWRDVVRLFVAAGRGLAAAHERGVVHRDFKPSNVLLGEGTTRVLVGDFGLAQLAADPYDDAIALDEVVPDDGLTRSFATRVGGVAGTFAYMSPEQLADATADARSDQFAFCVALWEALAGARPFAARTVADRLAAIARGDPTPLRRGVPARLREVVLRGLAPDPGARHPDMASLVDALAAAARRRSRAWTWTWVSAATLVAATGSVVAWMRAGATAPCDDSLAALAEVWNQDRRRAIAVALSSTSRPDAPETLTRVDASLVRYADAWSALRRDACERGRAGAPDRQLDMRVACLDSSLLRMGGAVDVLVASDAAVLDRASAMVDGLPPLERCERDDVARTEPPPPPSPSRERVAELRRRLAVADSTRQAGRDEQATTLLAELRAPAEALAYAPLVAEIELARGRAEIGAGRAGGAREALLEAAYAAEAAIELVFLAVEVEPDYAFAQGWAERAEAAVERAGSDRLRAHLLHRLGLLAERTERFDDARAHYESALATWESIDPAAPKVAGVLQSLGVLAETAGRFEEARAYHARVVDLRRAQLGPRHPEIARVSTNLAVALKELGRLEEAHAILLEALDIAEAALGPEHPTLAGILNNLGAVQRRLGDASAAVTSHRRAIAIRERHFGRGSAQLVSALTSLGAALTQQESFVEARSVLDRAQVIVEAELGAEHTHLAEVLATRGVLLRHTGRAAEAVSDLDRAVRIRTARRPGDPRLAVTLRELAEAQLDLGDVAAASGSLERALAIVDASGQVAAVERGRIHWVMARTLAAADSTRERAKASARAALRALEAAGAQGRDEAAEVERWLSTR